MSLDTVELMDYLSINYSDTQFPLRFRRVRPVIIMQRSFAVVYTISGLKLVLTDR